MSIFVKHRKTGKPLHGIPTSWKDQFNLRRLDTQLAM